MGGIEGSSTTLNKLDVVTIRGWTGPYGNFRRDADFFQKKRFGGILLNVHFFSSQKEKKSWKQERG